MIGLSGFATLSCLDSGSGCFGFYFVPVNETRSRERLDYHESGRKVTKVGGGTQNPEMDEQKIQELKLREDISHAFDIYAIDNLVTDVEIQETLRVISDM